MLFAEKKELLVKDVIHLASITSLHGAKLNFYFTTKLVKWTLFLDYIRFQDLRIPLSISLRNRVGLVVGGIRCSPTRVLSILDHIVS